MLKHNLHSSHSNADVLTVVSDRVAKTLTYLVLRKLEYLIY